MKKRIASILLAVMMIVTLLPLGLVDTAWAATFIGSGKCGDNVTWSLTSDGTLTISGAGEMTDYGQTKRRAPWYNLRSQVKSAIITYDVTNIGSCAFYGCENLENVTIPDTVTSIGVGAFSDCASLNKVTIPNGVTEIGSYAFDDCMSLKSVEIPNGVTRISQGMFSYCTGLTSVNISSNVTTIDNVAFTYCISLTSVEIPTSVTEIGFGAFSYSNVAVNVAAGNKNYCSEDGALYDKQKTVLLCGGACKGIFKIPDSVTSIDYSAFSNRTDLTSVIIPESVTHIGNYAFGNCYNLTDVYYTGSANDWAQLFIPNENNGNYYLLNATVHYDTEWFTPVVSISNSVTSGKPMLTWNAVPGADAYNVYRAENAAGVYTKINTTTEASYTDADAKAGVIYYYKVTAVNGADESAYSNIVSGQAKVQAQKPSAPVVKIGNSASSGKPMLTWNAVEGATSYRIYRSTSRGSGYSLLGTTTATSYTNTGAKAGTTYYYRVKACNDAGLSSYSNVVSGKVKSVTPKPAAPVVKIGHSSTSGKPMLTWNAVSGATSYKVYRATSQNGTYSLLGTVTTTSYINTGAKDGVTYYYKVKAVNSAGESAYSNTVSGQSKSVTPKPSAPVVKIGHSATSGKPMLTWNAVDGAASYKVYRATAKNGAYSVINTTKALTYTNVGAALGTTYYYKVEALNAAGKSLGFSDVVEGKVAPVLAVGYSSVSGKPQLTWKAVPGATEYQVYRSTQQNSGYTKINTTTSTSYVNTGAKANTTYYYRIVAVKGTAASDFSNIVSARPSK